MEYFWLHFIPVVVCCFLKVYLHDKRYCCKFHSIMIKVLNSCLDSECLSTCVPLLLGLLEGGSVLNDNFCNCDFVYFFVL